MKNSILVFLLLAFFQLNAQDKKAPDLKSILLDQLRSTHNVKDWFVPVNIAIDGLTPEQARWKDSSGNHSIGQLTSHLIFWNLQQLDKFKGITPSAFSGDNNETFNSFNKENWASTVQRLDSVLTAWEKAIETADDKKLQSWYSTIAHISTHNAYHTGQIIYIRKLQGSWDPEKGVK
ncbi:MAG TPA: DinB family protein [Chitinophagaceae bacterium]|nr:DinB family protein [Chitinophagaceae bacterium]